MFFTQCMQKMFLLLRVFQQPVVPALITVSICCCCGYEIIVAIIVLSPNYDLIIM